MKKSDLTSRQAISVDCPTCGALAGKRCVLGAGGLRFYPHSDRQLKAIETMESKKSD